jgi:hypothetical protein
MALSQKTTNERGAATIYHRIGRAELDFNTKKAKITILSYATPDLRHQEQEESQRKSTYDTTMDELNELVANPTPENETRRQELSDQLNSMGYIGELQPRHLVESEHEIDLTSDDFTLKDIYDWLKASVYTDSKDV